MFHGNCSQTQIGWMWYWHMLHLLQLASLQQHRTITSFRLLKGKNNWHIQMMETVRQYVQYWIWIVSSVPQISCLPLRNRSSAWSSDCETVSSGTGRNDLISCPLLLYPVTGCILFEESTLSSKSSCSSPLLHQWKNSEISSDFESFLPISTPFT